MERRLCPLCILRSPWVCLCQLCIEVTKVKLSVSLFMSLPLFFPLTLSVPSLPLLSVPFSTMHRGNKGQIMYLSLYLVSLPSSCLQLSTMHQGKLWFCLCPCFCVFVFLMSFPFCWSMPQSLSDQVQRRQKSPSSLMYTSPTKTVIQVCHQDNF